MHILYGSPEHDQLLIYTYQIRSLNIWQFMVDPLLEPIKLGLHASHLTLYLSLDPKLHPVLYILYFFSIVLNLFSTSMKKACGTRVYLVGDSLEVNGLVVRGGVRI